MNFNWLDNSKTGKAGEADLIIGIGKPRDSDKDYDRRLYLSKNKLTNDFEKKQHFFEMLEKERKRLVNAIVPDMSTIRQETDPVDKIIKGENVYNEIP